MWKTLSRQVVAPLIGVALLSTAPVSGHPGSQGSKTTNPDAQVMVEFQKRIDEYVKLRNKLKREAPPLKETKEPAEIQAAREGLAERIRAERKDAKPGDIFTPETKELFRRLMGPELKGTTGGDTKQALKEDAPKAIPLKVNGTYPEAAPLPTVPPNLLAALPKLPEDLEYRIVNRDLILLDVRANLIVDYIQNAIR